MRRGAWLVVIIFLALAAPRRAWSQGPADGRPGEKADGARREAPLRVDDCSAEVEPGERTDEEHLARAADLYDRGLVLYEEGDYAGAVDQFVHSYCEKPHPSAFYNIAQSYERQLQYERAVQYFERYVANTDEDSPNHKKAVLRAEVLRSLPAQVRVATVPAGAEVTIRSDTGIAARGTANATEPLLVPEGSYTMRIELAGYEPIEQPLVTEIGKPYSYYLRLDSRKGRVRVLASPTSSRIFLDDRLVGVGSYIDAVPVGEYELTVESSGRSPVSQKLQVSAAQTSELRIEVPRPPVSGRRPLLIASALGLGMTGGFALSNIFDQDAGMSSIGTLASLGIGFGGAYYGIPESVTRGEAWSIISATVIGAFEGGLTGAIFLCDTSELGNGDQSQSCNDQGITGTTLAGALAGAVGSSLGNRGLRLSTGDVALLSSGAFWGTASGALFYAVFDTDLRIRDPMLLVGLNLGLVTSASLVANTDVSLRRVAIIDLAGVGGVLGGVSLAAALEASSEQVDHFSIFGMVSGLVLGTFLTRYMDEEDTPAESVQPELSTLDDAGGHSVFAVGMRTSF
jgi:hypothetical protein